MPNIVKNIFLSLLLLPLLLTTLLLILFFEKRGTLEQQNNNYKYFPYVRVENIQKDTDLEKFPKNYDSTVETLSISLTQHQKTSLLMYGQTEIKSEYTNISDAYTKLIEEKMNIYIPNDYIYVYMKDVVGEDLKRTEYENSLLDKYQIYIKTQVEENLKQSIVESEMEEFEIIFESNYQIYLDEKSINDAYLKYRGRDEVEKILNEIVNIYRKENPNIEVLKNILLNQRLNRQAELYWQFVVIEGEIYVYPIYLYENFKIDDNNFNVEYDIAPITQKKGTSRVPILMYHQIDKIPEGSKFLQGLYVTPEIFEKQLAYLVKKNYKSVTPKQLYDILKTGKNPNQKSVMITFDDSTLSQYKYAYPLLKKYGLTGVFYVVTSRSSIKYNQLREMNKNGMIIDSHTTSHKDLIKLKDSKSLYSEIVQSRYTIRNSIGGEANSIAYPGCVIGKNGYPYVSQAGYLIGVSCGKSIDHTLSKRLSLARVHVFSSIENLKNILSGKL